MMMVIKKLTLLTGREHREKKKRITLPKGWKARMLSNTTDINLY
jgi:hypothetical protein